MTANDFGAIVHHALEAFTEPLPAKALSLLTQSRLSAGRTCQRMHHYKYDLGYRAIVELGGRKFGTLMHTALEAYWLALGRGADALGEAMATFIMVDDPMTRVILECLMTGYHHRWGNGQYEVLAVEQQFDVELRNPSTGAASRTWRLAGKVDVIVRDTQDGNVKLVEHKTSSEDIGPGSTYWRRLRMDNQVSVYFEGARALGHDVASCLYDVIGKPSIRPHKATPVESRKYTKEGKLYANLRENDETPEEFRGRLMESIASAPDRYFQRGEVVRLESEMAEAMADIWDTATQMREARLAGRAPRNPGSCIQYGRTCDFFEVCTGEASIDDASKFVRNADVHPELSAQGENSKEESKS